MSSQKAREATRGPRCRLGLISHVTCWGLSRLWNGCETVRWAVGGVCAECACQVLARAPRRAVRHPTPSTQVRDLCTGLCETGPGGPGGRSAPCLASLKGVESPWSLLPQCREQAGRSQWQGPGGRKPRAGGLAPTTRATVTGGTDRTCAARDAGGRRGSVLTSGSAPGSPCRLHRGVWTPHPVLCPAPARFRPLTMPVACPLPRLPYPANEGSFSLNVFSCET